jgi:hypothetical protein
MAYEWFASAFERYLRTMELSQRRLLDAQQDACISWAVAWLQGPALPKANCKIASTAACWAVCPCCRHMRITSET